MGWMQLVALSVTLLCCTVMICLAMPDSSRTTSIEVKLQKISEELKRIGDTLRKEKPW